MKRYLSLAILAAALAAAPAALAQQAIGIAAAVRNDVRIKKPGTPLPRPAQVKQRVALGDQVQTGVKSQLQLLLLDKSVFTVGANARLVIDRYVYDPARGSRSVGATVAKGAFRFMSGKPDRSKSSEIRTPIASIGIRGTILEGVVGESAALIAAGEPGVGRGVQSDPATASLIILRGPGAGARGNVVPGEIMVSAGGRSVLVDRPLMAVYVPRPGAAPIGPFHISPHALRQVQALLYPAVAERLGMRGPADNLGGDPASVYYPPARTGPTYPPTGAYPPGAYPPGALPPGQIPGGRSNPPGVGPGAFGVPNIPIPQPGPRRPRPNAQGNNPPPNNNPTTPPNNPPAPNNPTTPPNNPPAPNNPTTPPNNPPAPNNPPPPTNNPPPGPNSLSSAPPPNNPPPNNTAGNPNQPPNNPAGKPPGKPNQPPPPPPKGPN
jgi:hypothetical protein